MSELELGCIAFIQDELAEFKKLNLPKQKEFIKTQTYLINTIDMSDEMLKCNVQLLRQMKEMHESEINFRIKNQKDLEDREYLITGAIVLTASIILVLSLTYYYG